MFSSELVGSSLLLYGTIVFTVRVPTGTSICKKVKVQYVKYVVPVALFCSTVLVHTSRSPNLFVRLIATSMYKYSTVHTSGNIFLILKFSVVVSKEHKYLITSRGPR